MTAIVWIRRSLREYDNRALVEASKNHDEVIPVYIVDKEYFGSETLGYPRVKFWRESLTELKQILRNEGKDLVVRHGKPVEKLREVVEESGAEKLYFNRDYSPYSKRRDSKVRKELDIQVETFKDVVMFEKEEILTNSGTPYKVFTYYWKKWQDKNKLRPESPEEYVVPEIKSDKIPSLEELGFERPDNMDVVEGGRESGKERLEDFKEKIWNYKEGRDYPLKDATSGISADLKFGTISIREVYWWAERVKTRNPDMDHSGIEEFQQQLCWRDFYFQVMWNFPYCVEKPFLEKYESLEWLSKDEAEDRWSRFVEGKTGYPFVDAGMRQLKRKGWMHNRLRMLVTSFACKDLWLDWKDVHKYYKKMFVDAELASMIGGIQWAYSIGTDAQPYFRVFNPWKHGEDYDPEGDFIRKYVPELEDVPDRYIHKPHEMPVTVQEDAGCVIGEDYPKPIVDHDKQRKKAVEKFEQAGED